ncbi:LiaF transmembrane domain-containing protein [Streptococcus sp. Marseille-Q5112]|uniref:LiaF transmembrane domain-containing protein n=1 Tax=Streptococcus sp. Marseille-Q5112 TaxID=2866599 RepID=UPI001CE3FECD|nr:hypothetical protein [Streptococcus sp. Marseille-Q5112]
MKKKVFGIVLLVLAAWILFQGHYGVPSLDIKYPPFVFIVFLLYKAIESFLRHHWTSATFLALLALNIVNLFYDWIQLSPVSLIWASFLIVMGVSALTHSNRTKWWYDGEKTILTDKEVAFGSGTFYKQEQELVEDQVEVGFGNAKIYYDNAEILGDSATLKVEVGFGNAVIYVPKHWGVDLKVETFCGVAKADTPLAPTSKTLIIRGDVAFGKLGIVYVK